MVVCFSLTLIQVVLHVPDMPHRAHAYTAVSLKFLVVSSETVLCRNSFIDIECWIVLRMTQIFGGQVS